MRIAFYAPLKSPDHPVPSGDRQMARQIMAALKAGGHDVRLASQLRAHASDPDPEKLKKFNRDAAQETARVLEECSGAGAWRPELWLTYHNYYKAPDLIGPEVAQGLAIPYCGMESSFARKRRSDEWADWTAAAEFGMRRARLNFFMTDVDRQGLARLVCGDPLSQLGDVFGFFLGEFGRKRADLRVGRRVAHVPIIIMPGNLGVERDLQRLLAADHRVGRPYGGGLRVFEIPPAEIVGAKVRHFTKARARRGVGPMHARIFGQSPEQLADFAIA